MKKKIMFLSTITAAIIGACFSFSAPALKANADTIDGGTYSGDVTVKLVDSQKNSHDGEFQIYFKVANEGTLPKTWDNAYKGPITRNGVTVTNYELKCVADGGGTFFFWDKTCKTSYTEDYTYVFNGTFTSGTSYSCVLDNLTFSVDCVTPDLNYAVPQYDDNASIYFTLPANDIPFDTDWKYKMFPSYTSTLTSTKDGVTTDVAVKGSSNAEKTGSVVKYGATAYWVAYSGAQVGEILTFGRPELFIQGSTIYSLNLSGLSFVRTKDLSENVRWRRATTIESVELTNDWEVALKYSGVGTFADANTNTWAKYTGQSGLFFDYIYINNDPTYTFSDPRIGLVKTYESDTYCNMKGKADGKLYLHQWAGTVPMFTSGFFAMTFKTGLLLPTNLNSANSYSSKYATLVKDITFGMISGRKMVDATPVQAFVDQYMAMGSDTPNQCLTLYVPAKEAYNKLTADQKALFVENELFLAAKNRLQAWAIANGEALNASNTLSSSLSFNNIVNIDENLSITIAAIILVTAVSICFVVVIRKRRASR